MKVLQVIPGRADEAASMVFVRRQVAAIADTGVECPVFFLESRTQPRAILAALRQLRAEIRRIQPDIIHAQFGTVTALVAALAAERPLVITYRGSDLNPDTSVSGLRSFAQKLFSQLATLRAAHVMCVSRALVGRLWWYRRDVTIVPSGINLDLFTPGDRAEARRRLGWDADEPVVFFNAGKSPALKRIDLAEAAVAEAGHRLGRPVRLFVTRGTTTPTDIPVMMNAADCLILTSDFEGSPNVVKEATACNLPVVSVDVGDVRERLEGVMPSAVTARDPAALGAALADILRLGRRSNGRTRAEELRQDALAQKIAAAYRRVLGHA